MVIAIGLIAWNTYASWRAGPWELPAPVKSNAPAPVADTEIPSGARLLTSVDSIVSKNLFDPERGAGATREAEETSRGAQRVRNMILIGTVIIGNDRMALLQDGVPQGRAQTAPPQSLETLRLKVGDNVEGYRLAEIADKKVVFTKDAARVEILLDYFRKVEVPAPRAPTPRVPGPGRVGPEGAVPPVPRVIPNLPRRGRIPAPGNPNPDS